MTFTPPDPGRLLRLIDEAITEAEALVQIAPHDATRAAHLLELRALRGRVHAHYDTKHAAS